MLVVRPLAAGLLALLCAGQAVAQRPVSDEMAAIRADASDDKSGRTARLKSQRLFDASPPSCANENLVVNIEQKAIRPDGHLELVLSAKLRGVDIPVNNPYVFVNPPVLVPNGDKFVENVPAAFCTIVQDAVSKTR